MAVGVNVAVGTSVTVGDDVLVPVAVTEVGIVPLGLVSVLVVVGTNEGKDVGGGEEGKSVVVDVVIPATREEGEEEDNGNVDGNEEEEEAAAPIAVVGSTFGRTILFLLLLGDSVLFLGATVAGTTAVGDPDPVAGTTVVGDPNPALLLPSLAVVLLFCFQQSGL